MKEMTCWQVTMRVDGKYPERWRTVGRFTFLSSSSSFLGGSEGRENIPVLQNINNLVGCLKGVLYTTDTLRLDLLSLAQEGNSLMSQLGSVEWRCEDQASSHPLPFRSSSSYQNNNNLGYYLMQQGGVISFSDSQSYLVSFLARPEACGECLLSNISS